MSNFYRKGTVSKASGPTHSTSYAMRGVAVKYKAPLYVPELLNLPKDWVEPKLPSPQNFNYDYRLERRVSEQARHRAVSVAAEASLKRAQVQALRQQQQQQQQQEEQDTVPPDLPHPPLLFSSEILTPTPVAPPTSQNSPTVGDASGRGDAVMMTQQASSSSGEGGSSSSLIEDDKKSTTTSEHMTNEAVFKSLGNWSIKEFEGDVMDPFEITSLQAINDMEELQSVLLPTKPQQTAVAAPPKTTPTVVSHLPQLPTTTLSTAHIVQSPLPLSSDATPTAGAISVLSATHPTTLTSISSPELISSASQQIPSVPPGRRSLSGDKFPLTSGTSPQFVSPLTQPFNPSQDMPTLQVSTNPFISNIPPSSSSTTNPFLSSEPVVVAANHSPPASGPVPQLPQARQDPPPCNPEVGTLVDLGGSGTGHTQIVPPIPAPRTSPKVQHGTAPIPRPRPRSRGSPAPSPPVASKGITPHPTITTVTHAGSSPVIAARGVGNNTTGSPKFPSAHSGRINMGVAVLPQIPTPSSVPSSQAATINEPPPAYKLNATPPSTHRKPSPPPPYSSPHNQRPHAPTPSVPPAVPPKTYTLPNPEASLTTDQKQQVATIAGMGFPPQRVGRAILRFQDNQTQILDFLFLVGELEDAKFNGNSAETALITCKDDLEKAKAYLQKLEVYKEIGFQEKAIHDAYTKAEGDWDQALDILTKTR